MIKEKQTITKMISSPDIESNYLALNILRGDNSPVSKKESRRLIQKLPLSVRITGYEDICIELEEKPLTINDFLFIAEEDREKFLAKAQLLQIARLVNGKWRSKFDGKQRNWYPYFDVRAGHGLAFVGSVGSDVGFYGMAAFFKDRETSDFVGKTFIHIYEKLR